MLMLTTRISQHREYVSQRMIRGKCNTPEELWT